MLKNKELLDDAFLAQTHQVGVVLLYICVKKTNLYKYQIYFYDIWQIYIDIK